MGIKNPELLSDTEYFKAYNEYLFLRSLDREFELNLLKQAIAETLTGIQENGPNN